MSDQEKPLFKCSLTKWIVIGLLIFLVFVFLTIVSFVTLGGADIGLLIVYSLSMLSGILIARQAYFQPARSGKFFESKFTINGWKLNQTFNYSELKSVSLMRTGLSSVLTLDIAGIVINLYSNPQSIAWNTDSRTDLYSWLKGKITSTES